MKKKQMCCNQKRLQAKIFLVMKLTIVLILTCIFAAHANSWSQGVKLSLAMPQASIIQVLKEIENQSEFYFFYDEAELKQQKTFEFDVKDASIQQALEQLLQNTNLTYKIIDRYILISQKGQSNMTAQQPGLRTVSGKVTDKTNVGLPGVTVTIKGTNKGSITDIEGDYSLRNVPSDAILVFTFVGMQSREVPIADKTRIDIVMEDKTIGIEEVVAIGYGTQKKVNITGSVSTVNSKNLVQVVSTSTSQALQGRMSGIQVSQNDGSPGSGSSIKIRGIGSLKSNNSPLIVVDGFIGSLDDIAAGDIESISVLKDAASCAIYGSRAANGVILLTTKRGKPGKMTIDFRAEYGMQSITKKPDFLDAQEYAQKQNEERIYNKQQPYWTGDLSPEKLGQGTDWYGYIFDNQKPIQNYHLGISGGTESTRYAISLAYIDQKGIVLGSSYNRTNLRANFDHEFNKKIKLGVNIDLRRSNSFDETGGIFNLSKSIMTTSPTVPIFFPDGSPGIFLPSKPGEKTMDGYLTPNLVRGSNANTVQGFLARTNLFLEIELLKGLTFKSVFNKSISYDDTKEWTPTYAYYSPENLTSPAISNSTAILSNSWLSSDTWELQEILAYKLSIENHNISLFAGFSSEEANSKDMSGIKTNFPGNNLQVMSAGSVINSLSGTTRESAVTSLFGQINYDYKGKYLFQSNIRRDGSSVFAPGKQFGVFPSISAGWRLSEEPFIKKTSQISNLKLRLGYGSLGNAGIPQYAWISTYQLTDGQPFGSHIQVWTPAYYITDMTNPDIKWETTTTFDLGMDLGLFDSRLNVVADYYRRNTTDMLLDATIPGSSGYIKGPVINLGKVQNKGWELTASWGDSNGSFKYGASFNLSHNENTVIDMGGIKPQIEGGKIVKEGLPINSFWGYKTDGIFRTWDEVNSYPHFTGDFRPGEYKVVDVSGSAGVPDGKITAEDKVFLGDRNPKYYYGATLNGEWKGIDISILFSGETQKKALYENIWGTGPSTGYGQTMKYWFDNRAILDASGNVISGTTPVAGTKFNDWNYYSDGNIYDVSFLRVKNIQIGYSIPKKLLTRLKVSHVRAYINSVNPILFTKYIGADPETTSDVSNVRFGSSGRGGFQYYPVSKTYSVGISVKF
jgi:TonB-linked SusC/RagA family outer membrane protein